MIIQPRTAEVRIYQGDDLARLAELRQALNVAEMTAAADGPPRMGGDDAVEQARAAYEAFVDEAAERAVEIKLRAIPSRLYRSLRAEHPVRKIRDGDNELVDHEDDLPFGVNVDTFVWAFLPHAIVEPAMTPETAGQFLEALSDGDLERLFQTAFYLNTLPGSDPKAERLSGATLT